jgi:hypothetical protein
VAVRVRVRERVTMSERVLGREWKRNDITRERDRRVNGRIGGRSD